MLSKKTYWPYDRDRCHQERPDSDVDFLVEFKDGASLFDQGGMSYHLGQALGRDVDVIDYGTLNREPYFSYVVKKDLLAV